MKRGEAAAPRRAASATHPLPVHIRTIRIDAMEAAADSVIIIDQGLVKEAGPLRAVQQRHHGRTLEDIFVGLTGREGI